MNLHRVRAYLGRPRCQDVGKLDNLLVVEAVGSEFCDRKSPNREKCPSEEGFV